MNTYPMNPLTVGQANFNPYYTPMQNPFIPNYPVVQQPTAAPQRKVDCVNGKESAYTFPMGPNSSAILVDNLSPRIFFVTTDASGYKAVKSFKIKDDEDDITSKPIEANGDVSTDESETVKELTERLNKLEERMTGYEQSNASGKPDTRSFGQSKSGNGSYQSNDRNGQNSKGSNGNDKSDVSQ